MKGRAVLTHRLHGADQHISLYLAVIFIHGKPAIHRELVDFFVPHVIDHHLERHTTQGHEQFTLYGAWKDCMAARALSRNQPAEEPRLLWPMVIFFSLPRFGDSMVNLSSEPRSKLSLSLSSRLSPWKSGFWRIKYIKNPFEDMSLIETMGWLFNFILRQSISCFIDVYFCKSIL